MSTIYPISTNSIIENPFTIVFFGKTGVGKSTTINQLFGFNWDTDNAVACTKEPQVAILNQLQYSDLCCFQVQVVDMPGIGESIEADEFYMPYYQYWLPKAHSLVWITQADTRAYKRDQIFLNKLIPLFHSSLLFTVALNKIDQLGVDEGERSFNIDLNEPSQAQFRLLPEKIDDVYKIFNDIISGIFPFSKTQIVPYTAVYKWGLENFKSSILSTAYSNAR
ncbi:GTPase [Scytonema sp. UIC 10036]|uniref:GTPase n=1 Tax=Scytonema sp. UIC 10036 TaxID=2304196 RepID=UPI001A9A869C